MRVVEGFWEPAGFDRGTVVTFGKFDALHCGHQAIFSRVVELAAQQGRESVAVFFHPNPLRLLAPDRCPPSLTTVPQKLRLMEAFGLDAVVVARFDERMRATRAETFVELLARNLRMANVVVGSDARFGYRAQGDAEMLAALGERLGYGVETVAPSRLDDDPISSERVREAVRAGELVLAARLLGRRYSVEGVVVAGDKRGRTLGFPTANVDTGDLLLPPYGIYVAEARVNGATHGAAASLGVRPTFGGSRPVLEAYLLDFSGDLYDHTVELTFVEKIRDEMRFDSVDALLAQMNADVLHARRALGR